jgi:hypothetical protein
MALFPAWNQPSWIAALGNLPVKYVSELIMLFYPHPIRVSTHQSFLLEIVINLLGIWKTSSFAVTSCLEQGEGVCRTSMKAEINGGFFRGQSLFSPFQGATVAMHKVPYEDSVGV